MRIALAILVCLFITTTVNDARSQIGVVVGDKDDAYHLIAARRFADSVAATRAALAHCKAEGWRNCRVVSILGENQCGAFVTPAEVTTFVYKLGSSLTDARDRALNECQRRYSHCEARWGQCNVTNTSNLTGSSNPTFYPLPQKPQWPELDEPTTVTSAAISEPKTSAAISEPKISAAISKPNNPPTSEPNLTGKSNNPLSGESNGPLINYLLLLVCVVGVTILLFYKRNTSSSVSNETYAQPVQLLQQQAAEVSAQTKSQPFSNSGPVTGIALRLKRGERTGSFGKIVFTLDARMDISAENRANIEKYKLGNRVIYESSNREKYREKAMQHVDNTRDQPGLFASPGAQAWGLAKTLGRVGAAAINATASALSLRVTVNSLIAGVHVECKDMGELLEAEEAIKAAGLNLKAELEAATTFTGQEQVIDL